MQHESCVECDYLSICHGGCPVRTYAITGEFFVRIRTAGLQSPLLHHGRAGGAGSSGQVPTGLCSRTIDGSGPSH